MNPAPDMTPDELVELIDRLMSEGTQHLNLESGEQTIVHTFNTTECGKLGACAVPNLGEDEEEDLPEE